MDTKSFNLPSDFPKSESYQRHQKQRFWQILLPIIFGCLLILAAAVMVILRTVHTEAGGIVSQWADASLIWLILPVLPVALALTVVLAGMVYLMAKALNIIPTYSLLVQQYANLMSIYVKKWMNKIVTPFFAVKSFRAGLATFFSSVFGLVRK